MAKTDLSIIVLSHNTKELLKLCLESIYKADKRKITVETIVVDNASADGSGDLVRERFGWVKLIESQVNLGYSGGNNLGIKESTGRYILFLNSDVEIKEEALREMKVFLDSDIKIGAVTPKVMLYSGGMDPDCHRGFPTPLASLTYFAGLEKSFPKSKIFGQYHKFYLDLESPHEIDAGFGTFMVVRAEVVKKVGVWDEGYFFYGEDLDYFYRIKKAGWKVMFYPKVLALHHKGASSGLRKESEGVTQASREIRLKTARSSISAMERFYKKFYRNKYSPILTFLVLLAIKTLGRVRLTSHYLKK